MYCLRLFIIVLQQLHCLLPFTVVSFGVFNEKYVCNKLHLDWLLCE